MMLLKLLFAICAIYSCTLVSARSLEEDKSKTKVCDRDPQEWCSNFITATECNAVKYCIKNDWSKPSSSLNGDSCTECCQQIENIRQGIGSNTTKEFIEDALDYVCELTIFTRILRKQCEKMIDVYVDSHINDLLDLLKSDVDPRTICKVLDFCALPPTEIEPEDAAVYYDNIVLHFPAKNLEIFHRIEKSTEPAPALLGSRKCSWGPSYWCGNLTTSKECGSTTHCITNYWSQKQYVEDNDSVCQVCKDMVKQARDQLLSNETQEELKEVFEGSCKLIPLKEVREECIKLADEFVPELTEMLVSQMNPTAVCTVAGLCNSPRIDNLLVAAKTNPAATDLSAIDECVNCTVAFTSFERFMQSTTKEEVLARTLAVCSEFSSYSDLCNSLIVSNFEDIYDMLRNQLPPFGACNLAGMCSYRYHTHMSIDDDLFRRQVDTMLATPNDDLPCDLCKQLVHHFQELLVANTTEDEFQQMLHGMCQQTGKFKDECTKLVDENFKIIYQFLTEELDPSKICAEIGICPRTKNFVSDASLNLISSRVVASSNDAQLTNLVPVLPQEVTHTLKVDTDSFECKFCHTIMNIIQSELTDPAYEGDVKKVLEKVCTLVPSADQEKCDEFVDEYAETLIKVLADDTDPFVVCKTLRICPTDVSVSSGNNLCTFCQNLLHYIQEIMEDPKEEKQIEEAVKKVCTFIPNAEKDKCDEFISQYSALIITILSQEMDPSLVCPALKVCPSSSSPQQRCSHCQIFMTDLIKQLGENYRLDNIKGVVSSLAPAEGLEKSVTALELRMFHREQLVDMMTAEFDADESCVYMKFCDVQDISLPGSSKVIGGDLETNEISDGTTSKPSCEVCELFVKLYEKELMSNKTEEELEDMLTRFCSHMKNAEYKENCDKMVKEYVPVFFDLLKKNVSPRELCAAARLCSLRTLTSDVNVECRTCEMAVGSLESILGDPMMKEDVFEHAIKACDHLRGKSHMVCVDVISQLLPQVQGIVFDIPAWFVCTKLKMCPYGNAMDTSVCSNPKSWCQDEKTAFLCDRLKYCRKNAWSSSIP